MSWKGSIDVNGEEYAVTDDCETREEAERELDSLLRDLGDEATNDWKLRSSFVEAGVWHEDDE